ncbi:DUF7455 domain-containing protein [Arthrobacter russicus]|jgi:hypothetical protein|uniref:DUF7455 domain-containing protein n=1 Tax=Arthrobacter russicus TaxID=172040 RepID=A0ABU1JFL0_9MICC|nr:hypothetical protein [Arthrobacter russicus]MBQ1442464.1 hypothetical protein [Renibacterium sp.]MDN5670182.1 hypothetical protein [Renibacterium salmoninarum]MDR6271153.1 hypothetical protein [Arthrobacter russicus]
MTTATVSRELNALDRCDRCGAQAYVRVILESSGGELLFCGHHARAVEATLKPMSSEWHDETSRLFEKDAVLVDD